MGHCLKGASDYTGRCVTALFRVLKGGALTASSPLIALKIYPRDNPLFCIGSTFNYSKTLLQSMLIDGLNKGSDGRKSLSYMRWL